ncbi:MAG: methyltransferase domain-containing protein [Muribaculaceae bacterium]|nr:methyltransferase domain-containing protein [Muribaculaceae bacterium]
MTEAERLSFLKWLKGIPYEIKFWQSYYHHKPSLRKLYSWSDYGNSCRLDNFDVQGFLSTAGASPLMIDVGCALSYVPGTKFDNPGVRMDMIDPLAEHYNRILDDTHSDRTRLKTGMIELLSTMYAEGSVDLVHVRNALDHSANPMAGILECMQVLRQGGVLYLHHHINEAEREAYRGFHQYNIDAQDGRLIIWNRSDRIDVADRLKAVAEVSCQIVDGQYVVAVIRKTGALPPDLYNPADAPRRALEMMNLAVSAFNRTGFSAGYHFRKLQAAVAHPVMRRIPIGWVHRLKALVRH